MGKSEKKDKKQKEAKEVAPEVQDVEMEDVNVAYLFGFKPILNAHLLRLRPKNQKKSEERKRRRFR